MPATVTFKSVDGKLLLLPRARNFGSASIFIKRDDYEPELKALRHFVPDGGLAIDVGGSFGVFTLFLSNYVGRKGRVITFEPGELSFSILLKNAGMNDFRNIEVHNIALSNVSGKGDLYHIAGSPVNFSLAGEAGVQSEQVDLRQLDAVLSREDREEVSFIKVDVEGYETFVLEGSTATITAAKPVIMFEVAYSALARAKLSHMAPFEVLERLGYCFFRLNEKGLFDRCSPPSEGNIFAIPADRLSMYSILTER